MHSFCRKPSYKAKRRGLGENAFRKAVHTHPAILAAVHGGALRPSETGIPIAPEWLCGKCTSALVPFSCSRLLTTLIDGNAG